MKTLIDQSIKGTLVSLCVANCKKTFYAKQSKLYMIFSQQSEWQNKNYNDAFNHVHTHPFNFSKFVLLVSLLQSGKFV